ncbi:MAG: energy transducer TonB [Kiritimatiellia bacterium]
MSLVLHAAVLAGLLIGPLFFRACDRRKPPEQLTFVQFTVSIPPPPAPETPEPPAPVPPKPAPSDDVKLPDPLKPPETKKPVPPKTPKDIRQTNRVVRRNAPLPKDKPPSDAEIARLLKKGAVFGEKTVIPDDDQIMDGAYFNHVHERMYAVWQQPSQLKNLPGLRTEIHIVVEPSGKITDRTQTRSSGNALMDESVMKAVRSVPSLKPLPAGRKRPVDIGIVFEIAP